MSSTAAGPAAVEVRFRRRPPGRPLRRLGAGALVIAALAVGGPLSALRPTADVRERPYLRVGGFGQIVPVRTFDAVATDVRGAAKISQRGLAHDTSGVWLLVRVRLVARDRSTTVSYAALRDRRGRTYRQSTRIDQPLTNGGRTLQPGVPVEGVIAFEVPRDAATRLWLRLAQPMYDRRMDAMAEIPLLPVAPAEIQRWLADTTPAAVPPPRVVSP